MGYKDLGKFEEEDKPQMLGGIWTKAKPGQIYCSKCGSIARRPHGGGGTVCANCSCAESIKR